MTTNLSDTSERNDDMKTTKKLPFCLSLQFFAENDIPSDLNSDTTTDETGLAPLQASNVDDLSSAEGNPSDKQIEEEFEKLIKGGKFENAFKKRTQSIIDKRFKSFKTLEDAQAKQKPVLNFLSEKLGIDSSDPDLLLENLQKKFSEKIDEPKGNAENYDMQKRNMFISEKAKALSNKWAHESEELKKIFPSFDLKTELQNPAFSSLLKTGMPIFKAYTAAHSDQLIKDAVEGTAKKVAEQTFKSIRANGSRVAENGLHNGAGFINKTDVSSLTGEEIRDIIKQVENGSKIRF